MIATTTTTTGNTGFDNPNNMTNIVSCDCDCNSPSCLHTCKQTNTLNGDVCTCNGTNYSSNCVCNGQNYFSLQTKKIETTEITKNDDVKKNKLEPNLKITMVHRNVLNLFMSDISELRYQSPKDMTCIQNFMYNLFEFLSHYFDKNHVVQIQMIDESDETTIFTFNILDILLYNQRKDIYFESNGNLSYDKFYSDFMNAINKSLSCNNGVISLFAFADLYLSSLIPIKDNNNIVHKIYNLQRFFVQLYSTMDNYYSRINSIDAFSEKIMLYCCNFNYRIPIYLNRKNEYINEFIRNRYISLVLRSQSSYKCFFDEKNLYEKIQPILTIIRENDVYEDFMIGSINNYIQDDVIFNIEDNNYIQNDNETNSEYSDNENNEYDEYDEYDEYSYSEYSHEDDYSEYSDEDDEYDEYYDEVRRLENITGYTDLDYHNVACRPNFDGGSYIDWLHSKCF